MRTVLPESSVAVVYGTRPEIIKLAPLVSLLGPAARLISTGQHFDVELFDEIAADMEMPPPEAFVEVGGLSRASQIGTAVAGLESHLRGVEAVVVQGDTNSSLAGALTANAMDKPLFHVEAGLRSFDRSMPEEHNRVLVDHLADLCWAPTQGNVRNLLAEGIPIDRIELTGNSVVEALMAIAPGQSERLTRRLRLGCPAQPYVLVTLHRPENVDDPQRLQSLLEIFAAVPIPVVLPLHPRTKGVVEEHGMSSLLDRLVVFPPLGYRDFLSLLADCHLAVSDSGGIQEEVSVLKVPVIVVRRTTERPEVIGTFAVLRRDAAEVAQEIHSALDKGGEIRAGLRDVPSPFGDGSASKRMYSSLHKALT